MRLPYRKPGKFSNIALDPIMTKEKFVELERKIDKLKQRQKEAAIEVSRLAELGDFSENVEYQIAKGRLRGILNALLRLEHQLGQAVLIHPSVSHDTVQIGSNVTLESNNKQQTYRILGSSETRPEKGIISYSSPLGAALIGYKVNDIVIVVLAGKKVEYLILKIE